MRTECLAAAALLALSACAPTATVIGPDDYYPDAPDEVMDPDTCPDAHPESETAILNPARDTTRDAILDARRADSAMYRSCRRAHRALLEHERQRQQWTDERVEGD